MLEFPLMKVLLESLSRRPLYGGLLAARRRTSSPANTPQFTSTRNSPQAAARRIAFFHQLISSIIDAIGKRSIQHFCFVVILKKREAGGKIAPTRIRRPADEVEEFLQEKLADIKSLTLLW
jgi:hypothetical protein